MQEDEEHFIVSEIDAFSTGELYKYWNRNTGDLTNVFNNVKLKEITLYKPNNKLMDKRELTGKWYIKSKLFGRDVIMVEVKVQKWDDLTYGNGGGCYSPERLDYEKATTEDLIELGINYEQ